MTVVLFARDNGIVLAGGHPVQYRNNCSLQAAEVGIHHSAAHLLATERHCSETARSSPACRTTASDQHKSSTLF